MIPVSEGKEGRFLLAFTILYTIGLIALFVLAKRGEVSWIDSAKLTIALTIFVTTIVVICTEGPSMLAERFGKKQRAEGKEEGIEEGRKEVLDKLRDAARNPLPDETPEQTIARILKELVSKS